MHIIKSGTMYKSAHELQNALKKVATNANGSYAVTNKQELQDTVIDELIFTAVFSEDTKIKKLARDTIHGLAKASSIHSSSIHNLYMAFGHGKISGFTVPAFNIRAMTYDTARTIFRLAKKHNIGPFIFEIARSEITYTDQRPDEYTTSVLAAAIKENHTGPVFLQGDHYQFSKNKFTASPDDETNRLKDLIKESIDAEFFNIDIDASTLVDLTKDDLHEQQKNNFERTAILTEYIRSLQPKGTTISVGGEIGHIGGKNSTVSDFESFMDGYRSLVKADGISKVSVQTGTSHGGVPLSDGTIAKVQLDFNVLQSIGRVAREEYHIGGPVQHGASTLPNELFFKFVEAGTLEIHLATGFQNIVYDNMPSDLKNVMYQWIRENLKDEWEEGWSEEQFTYKTRKKAIGPFKHALWSLSNADKKPIIDKLEQQFLHLFTSLKTFNTRTTVEKYVR